MDANQNISLVERYRQIMAQPTPGQSFIDELMRLTGCREVTVRMWLCGLQQPKAQTRKLIAAHFGEAEEVLFPSDFKRRRKNNGK